MNTVTDLMPTDEFDGYWVPSPAFLMFGPIETVGIPWKETSEGKRYFCNGQWMTMQEMKS